MASEQYEGIAAREWAALFVAVGAIAWAAPLIRLAEAPALVVASLRLTLAAPPLLVAAWIWRREELRGLGRRDAAWLAFAGLALAGHVGFWIAGVQRTSVVASTTIVATQPLFVGLLAWLALGERLTRPLLLGIVIASCGALLLAGEDLGDAGSLRGDLLSALAAGLAAIYLVTGRRVRARLSNVTYAAAVNGIAGVVLLLALAGSGESPAGHGGEAYLYIALLALGPQLLGHGSLTWVLGSLPAAVVAVAVLGEPAGATAIGATVLDEVPTLLEWLGGAVMLAGVYVALRGGLPPTVRLGEGMRWPTRGRAGGR